MIGTVSVRVSVARPNMPLEPVTVFAGSAATVGVIDVPKVKCGVKVTGVGVSLTNADGVTQSVNAKLVSGVWCATFPSSHFTHTGFTGEGLQIVCGGTDENDVVRAWKLGVGDVTTAAADPSAVPADTSFASMKLRDAVPMAPVKGDFAVVNGRWSVWTGTAWSQVSDGSGEMNVIEKVQKNGVDLPITNKTVNVTVPTQASDIGAYALPTGGIPSTDMTSAVQTALTAAGTAVQPGSLAAVATSGAYADLTGKPALTNTYDFATNRDIIRATADLVRALGGTVVNDPTGN